MGPTLRDRQRLWSKAELGDYGPEAEQLLHHMRRLQVLGIILAGLSWVAGMLFLNQLR